MSATSTSGGENNGNGTEHTPEETIQSEFLPDEGNGAEDEVLELHLDNEADLERDLELHEEEQDLEGGLTLRRETDDTPLEAAAQRQSLLSVMVKYPKEIARLMACGTLSADASEELIATLFEQMAGCPVHYLTTSALTLALRRYATHLQSPNGGIVIAQEKVIAGATPPLFLCMERVLLTTTKDEQHLGFDEQYELTAVWFCHTRTMSLANGGKLTDAIVPIAAYYPIQGEQTGTAFTRGERSMVLPRLRVLGMIVPREVVGVTQHEQMMYFMLECLADDTLTSKNMRNFSIDEVRALVPAAQEAAEVVVVQSTAPQDQQ